MSAQSRQNAFGITGVAYVMFMWVNLVSLCTYLGRDASLYARINKNNIHIKHNYKYITNKYKR